MLSCQSILFATALLSAAADETAKASPDQRIEQFEREAAPVLIARCLECHCESEASGGLVLDRAESALRGGDSGPAIVPGDPDASLLIERIAAAEMPPERKGQPQPLPANEVDALRRWIAAGAAWPAGRALDPYERTTPSRAGRDWWSLAPVAAPHPPAALSHAETANPVDAFIQALLASAGMTPAPPADRRTLIRRVYYDLLGLPPAADEVEAFAGDAAPDAYGRLVARLLASPHYGERWARHWLDVARYADTCGYERDQAKPGAWKYRDWVVDAWNADMPYDEFVVAQLAGDELPDRNEAAVTATGFLRLGTWNDEPNDPEDYKYERLEDLVHAASSAFLGATVKCARCHDHKFDPIRQTDYYRLAAAFWPGPIEPRGGDLLGGPTRDELGYDALGWTDVRDPPPLRLLHKGESHRPGAVVEPGPLSMIALLDRPFEPAAPDARTTQRRLQLARWIVNPRNPLAARVFVNRLWQHHFGQGLVRTPDNFGFTGDRPSHPELLDWLASQFIADGWSAKRIHLLILTSQTYQQSSTHPQLDAYAARDPDNRLLWRAARRRRDAESLRDAMLAAGGRLDLRIGGPSFRNQISADALEGLSRKGTDLEPAPASEQGRRSLYIYLQRGLLPPMLTTFDLCDTTLPCGRRDVSVVAPQALALLNGDFAHAQSKAACERVATAAGDDPIERVRAAWRLLLAREPSDRERSAALEHLERQRANFANARSADDLALVSLCHVLMNSNEFAFID